MRISKMPPWRALKAGVYGPWVKALRDQVFPRARDMSSRRAASEQSEATLSSSILFVIAPERGLSPRRRAASVRLQGPSRSSYSQCSGHSTAAGFDLPVEFS
jgi:hypothetical protein